jgi:hypothetical protein
VFGVLAPAQRIADDRPWFALCLHLGHRFIAESLTDLG